MYILQLAAVHDDLRKKYYAVYVRENDDLRKKNAVHVREKDELRKENDMLKMKIRQSEQQQRQGVPVRRRSVSDPQQIGGPRGKSFTLLISLIIPMNVQYYTVFLLFFVKVWH